MAGIYIHIPFCRQACHYCDFHFSTSTDIVPEMVEAIRKEILLRKEYLGIEKVETIYFGGGTPSLLDASQLKLILNTIHQGFEIHPEAEVTIEANPDDLTNEKLIQLLETGFNRLSIGIQSFFDDDLLFMNRAHNSKQAREVVANAKATGFNNLTIDLIYGGQTLSNEKWKENLDIAFHLGIDHLSCYSLTIESRTALAKMISAKKIENIDELRAAEQFEILMERSLEAGFEHYEISNFARNGRYSKHNTSYWSGEPYLGVGPSAHSYDVKSRQWNVYNNHLYLQSLRQNSIPYEKEELTKKDKFNEIILTRLRTKWGISLPDIRNLFGQPAAIQLKEKLDSHVHKMMMIEKEETYVLSKQGMFFADSISADLFL